MTDRLKAWCHWKRKENHVSEDDLLMVRDIEALIEVKEAAKHVNWTCSQRRMDKLHKVLAKLEAINE